ncbi:MAG: GNAT family N-acetyltransferase [Flavobacteriaceae bacterium]|nr:GNAT family N-acetyltransferase [Flavobacteriaceae bacterium]
MINVKKAETAEDLAQCYELRYQILRKPWQQPRGSETDGKEHECITALALDENENPIGTGRLQMNAGDEAQIRYMAVADVQQGKGVGGEVLLFLEGKAKNLGAKNMALNARENAIPFYLKNGYAITADAEMLWGIIPHKRMEKKL